MWRAVVVLLMLLSVASCASVDDLRRRDEATCAAKGLQPDTPDFTACFDEQQTLRRLFMMRP